MFGGMFFDLTPLKVFLSLILVYIVNYVLQNYKRFQYWKSIGIPEVMNNWLIHYEMIRFMTAQGTDLGEEMLKNIRRLGTIYGANENDRNSLVVADAEAIKDILVKDFGHFMDRQDLMSNGLAKHFLSSLNGEEWKDVRPIISPTFSSGKMKAMFPLIIQSLESTMRVIDRTNGDDLDSLTLFRNYTMDVIGKTAFAVDINCHDDPNDPFVKNAKNVINFPLWKMIVFFLPKWILKLIGFHFLDDTSLNYLIKVSQLMIDERRKSGKSSNTYPDFLQLMIEASASSEEQSFKDSRKKTLTDDEIIANIILMIIGGYSSTSATLAFAAYEMALHSEVQERARQEVLKAKESNGGKIDHETLNSLPYLEAILNETLRIHPTLVLHEKQCSEDYVLKVNTKELGYKEIPIKKGFGIMFPTYAIHFMEEYYPEPRTFRPERFLPENKDQLVPYTFLSFVAGPRNCVGMRFALLEMKLALANILSKYRINKCSNTKVPVELDNPFTLAPKEIVLSFEKIN